MVRIVSNVHNDRHSARHPEASQNAYHCERCVQSELSDMCYQIKTMSLVTLLLLTTLYVYLSDAGVAMGPVLTDALARVPGAEHTDYLQRYAIIIE